MTFPIVDSHIHFWDPDRLDYGWLANIPHINRAYLPVDLMRQAGEQELQGIVFVQADCAPEQGMREAEWVTSLAEGEPRIQGIVAFAPLEQGTSVRPALAALSRLPLVKGVRRLIQAEGPGFCVQPEFVAGVQMLPAFGFSFDMCITHHQLDDALALVRQSPAVTFVLDHIGKPDIKAQQLDPWRRQIVELAGCPNVWCKISGLMTEADPSAWTPRDLRPYIDHVIDAFGIDRVMYGGDWPVSLLAGEYRTWIRTLEEATAHLGSAAQHKLFAGNARACYRLA